MKNYQFNTIIGLLLWIQGFQMKQDLFALAFKVIAMFYMIAACIQKWKDN